MNSSRLRIGTGLRTVLASLALAAGFATTGEANPISQTVDFSTSGTIGGETTGPVTFKGESDSSTLAPGTITLGDFKATSLPTGATLTYNDTPFTITGTAGPTSSSSTGSFTISGLLNGTLTDSTGTTLIATITGVTSSGSLPFTISSLTTSLEGSGLAIAPSGIDSGKSALAAQIQPASVPEPATITLFVSALGGLALRRRLRAAATV